MFKYFKEVCAEHGDFSVIKFLAFHIGNSYARVIKLEEMNTVLEAEQLLLCLWI